MKKIISIILAVIMAFTGTVVAFASKNSDEADALRSKFADGVGPEVNGIAIDYVSYTPETKEENTKYPLLILIHGMGQGSAPREQLEDNNFSMFAGEELQSRFTNGGAYIFVPRSDESNDFGGTWSDDEDEPLYVAIKDYISKNADGIDTTRIYIGGYSMGGKMTLKMISSYPEMFAAAFPMCPAYITSTEQLEAVSDMPIWLMVSKFDILAGYHVYGKEIWNGICETTNRPSDCRLSLFGKVCYADGTKTTSNHHVWFAACNDMFSSDGGDYANMTTSDANGKAVKLTYPDGLISWLCSYTSSYDGGDVESTGLVAENTVTVGDMLSRMLKSIIYMFSDTFTTALFSVVG